MCVCVCVCSWVNHFDVIRLGVKVDQGLPCVRHCMPRSSGNHSKDTWWFPNTFCLMVIKAGQSQSHWRRYCSCRRQFRQIGSCHESNRLRYCLREGWWPDCRRARRTSSFLLFICFVSQETLWCWYTKATHTCVYGASRIVPLITWMELDREIGRIVPVAMVVASLAVFFC